MKVLERVKNYYHEIKKRQMQRILIKTVQKAKKLKINIIKLLQKSIIITEQTFIKVIQKINEDILKIYNLMYLR